MLAVLYTLYFARSFLVPIACALLLSFLLSPFIRFLQRFRVAPSVSAGITVLSLVAVLGELWAESLIEIREDPVRGPLFGLTSDGKR